MVFSVNRKDAISIRSLKKRQSLLPGLLFFLIVCLTPGLSPGEDAGLEDDGSRVSVLGYHVFHPTFEATQMRIPTAKFRKQMETIKNSNIPVITLEQFLAWRQGKGKIPPQAILITMDDGWRSVYKEAFPIMKEFKLPFTLYLYKNYVGAKRGSRALTLPMIKEMLDSKLCSLGSHSVSHPFPSQIKKEAEKGAEDYEKFLRKEFGDSKVFLEKTFKKKITSYAYPGGYHTGEMYPLAKEIGYKELFTVEPGKVRRNSPGEALPRYIVLGNHDGAFNAAMVFRNSSRFITPPVILPHPVSPAPSELVEGRLPRIKVDLSGVENLDPSSVVMRVAGFGKVPLVADPAKKLFQWTVTRPLRQPACEVRVQWKLLGKEKPEPVMKWAFQIDREAAYQALGR